MAAALSFKDILFDGDNWIKYQEEHQPPLYVIEAVEKIRMCRTGELGYHYWYCEECGFGGRSPHSCKSKLCSSCATIATKKWLSDVLPSLLNIKYYQVVFTLHPWFHPLFLTNKKVLYNIFFKAASRALMLIAASHDFVPGIVIVLHPFGSKYNVHPHLHCMVTAGGLTLNSKGWFTLQWWPLELTRDTFKALFYKELRKLMRQGKIFNPYESKEAFYAGLQKLYPKNWNLFVKFKDGQDSARFGLSYISRYAKRALIADHKLLKYDGEHVTFKTKNENTATFKKDDFIARVLRHIMPKYFKTTRFYGLYSNRKAKKLVATAKEILHKEGFNVDFDSVPEVKCWRERKKESSGKDPLLCPHCGNELTLIVVTYSSRIPKGWEEILSLSSFDHFL